MRYFSQQIGQLGLAACACLLQLVRQIGQLGLAACACLLKLVRQIGQLGLAPCACLLQLRQVTLQFPFPTGRIHCPERNTGQVVAQFADPVEDQRVGQGEFREHRHLAPYVIREITLSEHDTATPRARLVRRSVFREKHRRSGCHRFMQIGDRKTFSLAVVVVGEPGIGRHSKIVDHDHRRWMPGKYLVDLLPNRQVVLPMGIEVEQRRPRRQEIFVQKFA